MSRHVRRRVKIPRSPKKPVSVVDVFGGVLASEEKHAASHLTSRGKTYRGRSSDTCSLFIYYILFVCRCVRALWRGILCSLFMRVRVCFIFTFSNTRALEDSATGKTPYARVRRPPSVICSRDGDFKRSP